MNRNRRVTIVEVANRLDLATSTVSRALNRPQMLRPETVALVRKTVREMGYEPNPHGRALITGRNAMLGLVVADITNPFFGPMIRAAQHKASEQDCGVMIVDTESDAEREWTMTRRLIPRVDGLILASSRLSPARVRELAETNRVVFINRDEPRTARILVQSSDALRAGLEHMVTTGARRLAYFGGPQRSWSDQERLATTQAFARELGLELQMHRVESGTYHEARYVAESLVGDGVDAVVAFDDVIAYAVLDSCLAAGLSVPEDVQFIGCDDALPIQTTPSLTTIRLRTEEAADRAVQILLEGTESTLPEQRVAFQGDLVLRGTTRT